MKKVLVDLWFPHDYYDILDHASVDYRSVYSYEKQYFLNMKERPQNKNYYSHVLVSRKKNGLRIDKMHQFISKENFEVV